ncbi:hypothetical protein C6Q02_15580 [Burkholderia multivorans]|nr:hypothetical protein C6Q02_15580 [Burkholderia multivorans]
MQSGCGDAGSPQRPRQGAARETGRRLLFCETSTECRVAVRRARKARGSADPPARIANRLDDRRQRPRPHRVCERCATAT